MATPLPQPANGRVEPDSYAFQWLMLAALIAGFGIHHWHHERSVAPPSYHQASAVASAPAHWFLALRMPPITAQYESGIDTMRLRYGQWLEALSQAGFYPMKLSDVLARMKSGEGVPEKTVVLIFDPGYRRTFQWVAPILISHHWPAVWLSNEEAMRHGHREYITYHAADAMIRSGWWDVGFTHANKTFVLKSLDHGTQTIKGPQDGPAWSTVAGGVALNAGTSDAPFNRLNINSDWTPTDLINRVRAEVPVTRPTYLTEDHVQNLSWGVTTENPSDPNVAMNLQTLSYKRGFALDWFGTEGISNVTLESQADAFVGEVCLRLRWDEARGNGITVLIANDAWTVLEQSAFQVVKAWHYSRSSHAPGFKAALTLHGNQFSISMDQKAPDVIMLTTTTEAGHGLFQLFLVDKYRGTARASSVRIHFSPLAS